MALTTKTPKDATDRAIIVWVRTLLKAQEDDRKHHQDHQPRFWLTLRREDASYILAGHTCLVRVGAHLAHYLPFLHQVDGAPGVTHRYYPDLGAVAHADNDPDLLTRWQAEAEAPAVRRLALSRAIVEVEQDARVLYGAEREPGGAEWNVRPWQPPNCDSAPATRLATTEEGRPQVLVPRAQLDMVDSGWVSLRTYYFDQTATHAVRVRPSGQHAEPLLLVMPYSGGRGQITPLQTAPDLKLEAALRDA